MNICSYLFLSCILIFSLFLAYLLTIFCSFSLSLSVFLLISLLIFSFPLLPPTPIFFFAHLLSYYTVLFFFDISDLVCLQSAQYLSQNNKHCEAQICLKWNFTWYTQTSPMTFQLYFSSFVYFIWFLPSDSPYSIQSYFLSIQHFSCFFLSFAFLAFSFFLPFFLFTY